MQYASRLVPKVKKKKYRSYGKHQWYSTGKSTQRRSDWDFIRSYNPRYKLRAKENVVHNSFGRGSVHYSIGMISEVLHQFMMVIPTG